jgi:hypothetical protein
MRQLFILAALLFTLPTPAAAFDWVAIGDPGNPGDSQSQGTFGSVGYIYQITATEMTNAQYAEFLNAVAAADPNALYSSSMDTDPNGGITRTGSPGSYSYAAKPGFEDRPVNFVSFYDALRFANWMHNGQPTGAQGPTTTEDGAYTITQAGIDSNTITRNPGATFFLTSEDEWYKAAYYDGVSDYFGYPTGSDNEILCVPPENDTGNAGNCWPATSPLGSVTEVGAYTLSPSPSGTFDQGGNVWEWNEAIINVVDRGIRGGSFTEAYGRAYHTQRSIRWAECPSLDVPRSEVEPCVSAEINEIGFRIATILPACDNGLDDDGDGLIDLADPGCADVADNSEQEATLACDNGLDDDGDGLIDLADPGCADVADDSEQEATLACDNGLDDDGDGLIDLLDPGCSDPGDSTEVDVPAGLGLLHVEDCASITNDDPGDPPWTQVTDDDGNFTGCGLDKVGWESAALISDAGVANDLTTFCLFEIQSTQNGANELGCVFRHQGPGPVWQDAYVLQASERDSTYYFWYNESSSFMSSTWEVSGCFASFAAGDFIGMRLSGTGAGTTAEYWNFGATAPADKEAPSTWGPPNCTLVAGAQVAYQDAPGAVGIWMFNQSFAGVPVLGEVTIGEPR